MSDDLVFGEAVATKPARKPAAKKPAAKKAQPVVDETPKAGKNEQSGWPIVWIDAVEGLPNYETVGVNGKVYQIMREIEVPVPPEVVEVLRNAIGTRLIDAAHPAGGITRKVQKFSAIPWRLVGYVS